MMSKSRAVALALTLLAGLCACGGNGGDTTPNPTPIPAGNWTWMSGGNTLNQLGIYGVKGTANMSNVPGARDSAVSWIDPKGKLWLFGGFGVDSAWVSYYLNDLWTYDPATFQWTWVSGSNLNGQSGIYGTQGLSDPSNVPGARHASASWLDAQGHLWVFGGFVED